MAVPRCTGGSADDGLAADPDRRPWSAVSWPAIMRRIVVLPQPDGPSRQQ